MNLTDEQVKVLKDLAIEAGKKRNLPTSAILIKDNKIAFKAASSVASDNMTTHHGEILVINQACQKEKSSMIKGYTLVSAFEPCLMCTSAAFWAGIKEIYYILPASKYIKNIPWCSELKETGKQDIIDRFTEPVKVTKLDQYEKEFAPIFDEYVKNIVERK